jgi:spermidine synthase
MTFDAEQIHVKPFIYETRKTKSLHFSIAEVQSCMDLTQPNSLDLEYTRTMMGFLLFESARVSWRPVGLSQAGMAACSARCR